MASQEQLDKDWSQVPIPQSYADLYANYGDPSSPTFETDYITTVTATIADGSEVSVHCHVAAVASLEDIFARCSDLVNEYNGCYVVRDVRGGTDPSIHSWGLAIDFNYDQFPLGSTARQDPRLLQAFADHNWFYGGDFRTRKDPNHWQRAGDF